MKIINIFNHGRKDEPALPIPTVRKLVGYVRTNSVNKIVAMLATRSKSANPVAIPYTPEAIESDLSVIYRIISELQLSDDELAALLVSHMMHKHYKSVQNVLAENGYIAPSLERIQYIGTYFSTIKSLNEFASIGVKKYKVSSCGDGRVCLKCAKQDDKTHAVNKAVIGKTLPPFCEKCRCIITPIF